jgi:hypothetical protein
MQAVTITQLTAPEFRQIIREEFEAYSKSILPSTQPKLAQTEGYITQTEARKFLGNVSDVTMWQYRKKGLLKAHRLGKMIRYKESELVEALGKINPKK